MIGVGDKAPDFTLPGVPQGNYSLGDYLGKIVVLAFYPADKSPICTTQLRSYTADLKSFQNVDAVVLGISPQGIASHEEFYIEQAIGIPLLADEDKSVAEKYNVLGPLGFYRRSIFVISRSGVVTYVRRTTAGLTYSPTSVLLKAVSQVD